jgi:hypothetical protein
MESMHIVVEDVLSHEEDLDYYLKQTKDEIISKTKELESIVSERYFDIISLAGNLVHLSSDLENYELRLIAPKPFEFKSFEEKDAAQRVGDLVWERLNKERYFDALELCMQGGKNGDRECEDILIYLSDVHNFSITRLELATEWISVYAVLFSKYEEFKHLLSGTISRFVRNTVEFSLNELLVYKIKQVLHTQSLEAPLPSLTTLLSNLESLLQSHLSSSQLNSFLESHSSSLHLNITPSHISLILSDLEPELLSMKSSLSETIINTKDISSISAYLADSSAVYFSLWSLIKDVWIDRTLSLIHSTVLDSLIISTSTDISVSAILQKFEFDVSEATVLLQKIQFEKSFKTKLGEYFKNTFEDLHETYCKGMENTPNNELLSRAGVALMLPTTQFYKGNY